MKLQSNTFTNKEWGCCVHLAQHFSNKYYCNQEYYIAKLSNILAATSSVKEIGTFKRAELQWLSSSKHIIQIFTYQRQTACNNMNDCYKC